MEIYKDRPLSDLAILADHYPQQTLLFLHSSLDSILLSDAVLICQRLLDTELTAWQSISCLIAISRKDSSGTAVNALIFSLCKIRRFPLLCRLTAEHLLLARLGDSSAIPVVLSLSIVASLSLLTEQNFSEPLFIICCGKILQERQWGCFGRLQSLFFLQNPVSIGLYLVYLASGNNPLPISVKDLALSVPSADFQKKVLETVGSFTDYGSLDVIEGLLEFSSLGSFISKVEVLSLADREFNRLVFLFFQNGLISLDELSDLLKAIESSQCIQIIKEVAGRQSAALLLKLFRKSPVPVVATHLRVAIERLLVGDEEDFLAGCKLFGEWSSVVGAFDEDLVSLCVRMLQTASPAIISAISVAMQQVRFLSCEDFLQTVESLVARCSLPRQCKIYLVAVAPVLGKLRETPLTTKRLLHLVHQMQSCRAACVENAPEVVEFFEAPERVAFELSLDPRVIAWAADSQVFTEFAVSCDSSYLSSVPIRESPFFGKISGSSLESCLRGAFESPLESNPTWYMRYQIYQMIRAFAKRLVDKFLSLSTADDLLGAVRSAAGRSESRLVGFICAGSVLIELLPFSVSLGQRRETLEWLRCGATNDRHWFFLLIATDYFLATGSLEVSPAEFNPMDDSFARLCNWRYLTATQKGFEDSECAAAFSLLIDSDPKELPVECSFLDAAPIFKGRSLREAPSVSGKGSQAAVNREVLLLCSFVYTQILKSDSIHSVVPLLRSADSTILPIQKRLPAEKSLSLANTLLWHYRSVLVKFSQSAGSYRQVSSPQDLQTGSYLRQILGAFWSSPSDALLEALFHCKRLPPLTWKREFFAATDKDLLWKFLVRHSKGVPLRNGLLVSSPSLVEVLKNEFRDSPDGRLADLVAAVGVADAAELLSSIVERDSVDVAWVSVVLAQLTNSMLEQLASRFVLSCLAYDCPELSECLKVLLHEGRNEPLRKRLIEVAASGRDYIAFLIAEQCWLWEEAAGAAFLVAKKLLLIDRERFLENAPTWGIPRLLRLFPDFTLEEKRLLVSRYFSLELPAGTSLTDCLIKVVSEKAFDASC